MVFFLTANDAEIPKQELTDEADRSPDTEEEELCSTSAVLENISAETSQEFLEMLVENVLKGLRLSSQKFSLEMLPEISSAVVTFQTGAGTLCWRKLINVGPKNLHQGLTY